MAVVVATRMKPVQLHVLPRFLAGSLAAARQAGRTPGFLGGRLRAEPFGGLWTLTMWESGRDVVGYRDSGAHRALVPRLSGWASEAVLGVWNTESPALPGWDEAARRIAEHPRFWPLDRPRAAHVQQRPVRPRRLGFVLPVRASRAALRHP